MYLGLAATAFLLVMLHPSKEEENPNSPAAVQPVLLEGVQVNSHLWQQPYHIGVQAPMTPDQAFKTC